MPAVSHSCATVASPSGVCISRSYGSRDFDNEPSPVPVATFPPASGSSSMTSMSERTSDDLPEPTGPKRSKFGGDG